MDRFRPAVEQDGDAITSMMRKFYAENGYPFADAEALQAVTGLVRDDNLGRLWAILDRTRIVGYLAVTFGFSLEYRGRDAFIDELFVAEEARGKGLGREGSRSPKPIAGNAASRHFIWRSSVTGNPHTNSIGEPVLKPTTVV